MAQQLSSPRRSLGWPLTATGAFIGAFSRQCMQRFGMFRQVANVIYGNARLCLNLRKLSTLHTRGTWTDDELTLCDRYAVGAANASCIADVRANKVLRSCIVADAIVRSTRRGLVERQRHGSVRSQQNKSRKARRIRRQYLLTKCGHTTLMVLPHLLRTS